MVLISLCFWCSVRFHSEIWATCTLENVTLIWCTGLVTALTVLGFSLRIPSSSVFVSPFPTSSSSLYNLPKRDRNPHAAYRFLSCLHSLLTDLSTWLFVDRIKMLSKKLVSGYHYRSSLLFTTLQPEALDLRYNTSCILLM